MPDRIGIDDRPEGRAARGAGTRPGVVAFLVFLALPALLAGCATPEGSGGPEGPSGSSAPVQTLDDVELAEDVDPAELGRAPTPNEPILRPGLLGAIFGAPRSEQSGAIDDAVTTALSESAGDAPASETSRTPEVNEASEAGETVETGEVDAAARDVDAAETSPETASGDGSGAQTPVQPRRAGFLSALFAPRPAALPRDAATPAPSGDEASAASREEAPDVVQAAAPARTGFRLFGRARAPDTSEAPEISPGTPLAFGQVGRVCGLRGRALGTEVERFPERRSAYKLYDSAPGGTQARPFYITGFADGCARQVTAANVIFGAPSMHERLRYGLPAGTLPSSETDEAYKTLKSRICRVGREAPCGARIDRLEANTVFVTMYASFSRNQQWSNLLLHAGEVHATDIKQTP